MQGLVVGFGTIFVNAGKIVGIIVFLQFQTPNNPFHLQQHNEY